VDTNFLKAHAERCRLLAENADEFTKRRLLDLAAHYDKQLRALLAENGSNKNIDHAECTEGALVEAGRDRLSMRCV